MGLRPGYRKRRGLGGGSKGWIRCHSSSVSSGFAMGILVHVRLKRIAPFWRRATHSVRGSKMPPHGLPEIVVLTAIPEEHLNSRVLLGILGERVVLRLQ